MAVKLNLAEDLKDFSKAAKDKKYKRINYDTWKILKHLSDLPDSCAGLVGNYIYYKKEAGDALQRLTLCEEDSGFIHFLRDKYYFTSAYDTNTATTALNSSNAAAIATATSACAYGTVTLTVPSDDYVITTTEKKEKENVNMKGFNFDFGPCTNDNVRMSMYGLAVRNNNDEWVSYNNGDIVNVDAFNFDGRQYMYKMPVALTQIAVGDIIIHNRKPMFVVDANLDAKDMTVVDVCAGESKHIIPTTNMFGFNFVTKVVSLFDMVNNITPSPEMPFGNMLPFLMSDDNSIDPMMMMLMCNNGGKVDMFNNPMMMYMLMKNNDNDNMLPLLMMMNMQK